MIDVANESGVALDGLDEGEVASCARYVLDQQRVHPDAELSVLLVDPATITALHAKWLDDPTPTDVMSFPMDELRPGPPGSTSAPGLLGDVVVCPQVAATQAAVAGHATAEEILLLTIHGILHLLGYDHAEPEEEKAMFTLQRTLLLTFIAEHR